MKKIIVTALIGALTATLFLSGCGAGSRGLEMESTVYGMTQEEVMSSLDGEGENYYWNFSSSLFKKSYLDEKQEGSLLISPLSVYYALAMLSNGADEMTRCQLLDTLAYGESTGAIACGTSTTGEGDIYDEIQENLNTYLRGYLNLTSISEKETQAIIKDMKEFYKGVNPTLMKIANSIWIKNDPALKVEEDFLKINSSNYDAGIQTINFDSKAAKTISKWIEDHTGGTIKDMIKKVPDEAIMYLVNALSFEGDWISPFEDYQIQPGDFYGLNETKEVDFMTQQESTYLEGDNCTGFVKPYIGGEYAFVGILPNEGISIEEFIEGMSSDELKNLMSTPIYHDVIVTIPKFETESSMSLKETLDAMGIKAAFDSKEARFNKLGTYEDGNIYVGDVMHNTYISVHEKGTKAGAATVVEMLAESAAMDVEPPKYVTLNRPFFYMLMDINENIPVFMGVIEDL